MAQEKREKHWFQKERRKDRTKDRARMLGKKWERERQGEREFRIKFTVFKFFFLVSLLSLFWSLSHSRDLFARFFIGSSPIDFYRALSISRETLLLVPLVPSSRSPGAYVFFPTRFSGIPPLLTAALEERRESGRARKTTFLASLLLLLLLIFHNSFCS